MSSQAAATSSPNASNLRASVIIHPVLCILSSPTIDPCPRRLDQLPLGIATSSPTYEIANSLTCLDSTFPNTCSHTAARTYRPERSTHPMFTSIAAHKRQYNNYRTLLVSCNQVLVVLHRGGVLAATVHSPVLSAIRFLPDERVLVTLKVIHPLKFVPRIDKQL